MYVRPQAWKWPAPVRASVFKYRTRWFWRCAVYCGIAFLTLSVRSAETLILVALKIYNNETERPGNIAQATAQGRFSAEPCALSKFRYFCPAAVLWALCDLLMPPADLPSASLKETRTKGQTLASLLPTASPTCHSLESCFHTVNLSSVLISRRQETAGKQRGEHSTCSVTLPQNSSSPLGREGLAALWT